MANQTNARSFGLHVLATVKEKQMADIDAKKIELLPCPFCGGAAQAEHFESKLGRWRWSIGCNDHKPEAEDGGEPVCECYGFQSMTSFATKAEAIVAWNRRAIPSLAGEAVEGLAYTGAISLASIDEGAPRPETWKERAENQQAVFLLAKRRAEAAETRAEELEKALDREIAHADELRQSATSATMREAWDVAYTSLYRARATLEAPND